ncbi:hypothetical protein QNI16_21630 [Cytophagaceae bacterium YF14B1]|uniref:Uncharacterized protein n=1 Tax=Xanthocytophaga flava TaxID=3048013 RepID=A0AAE3QUP8_9BACT|nr:hypothetical protein [Xanthocytophaga flavus]MDJ1483114.1 hypothetical protein [Xanthocytophaga flavus]
MLTQEKKQKIQREEAYRDAYRDAYKNEIEKNKPKSKIDLVETIIKLLQGLSIIAGIWATFLVYQKQNEDRALRDKATLEQTAKEFRKVFYDKQFQLYFEACSVASILATEEISSSDYQNARKQFYRLYWGQLSFVEDKNVEKQMILFKYHLEKYEKESQEKEVVDKDSLKYASLNLAHAARNLTFTIWLDSTERENYNR